jgi:hypothetical protein
MRNSTIQRQGDSDVADVLREQAGWLIYIEPKIPTNLWPEITNRIGDIELQIKTLPVPRP